MRALRESLPRDARAARSKRIAERVVSLSTFANAATVLSFAPIRAEADPGPVVDAARRDGKHLALPRVDREQDMLVLHRWEEDDALEKSRFGVPEPDPGAPRVDPGEVDFVLVPALALDSHGYRIGYGKGFYDRLLPTLHRATWCAVAYDFQLVIEVPHIPGDQPVHCIVTDERVIDVTGEPRAEP